MLSFLTRIVFPELCMLCRGLLRPAEQSVCQICLDAQPRCSTIELVRPKRVAQSAGADFFAVLLNTPSVSTLCHSLKYGGNPWLAKHLGYVFLGPILFSKNKPLILIPMPISSKRHRKRGYNQSERLAIGCLQRLRKNGQRAEVAPLLEKHADKRSQIEMDPFERWTNPRGSLQIRPKIKQRIPEDALLVLIDDTVTTGSTLICAAEVIKESFPDHPLQLLALALEA